MSFLSSVNEAKVASIADVSVLLSTTRKFFCASAPFEMCYIVRVWSRLQVGKRTPMPARRRPVTESCHGRTSAAAPDAGARRHTSSPMTARNSLFLKSACDAISCPALWRWLRGVVGDGCLEDVNVVVAAAAGCGW